MIAVEHIRIEIRAQSGASGYEIGRFQWHRSQVVTVVADNQCPIFGSGFPKTYLSEFLTVGVVEYQLCVNSGLNCQRTRHRVARLLDIVGKRAA